MFGRRRVLLAAGAVLLGAAVAEELMKPREQRTWEGRILDLIPYDLRIATPEGFREAKANPSQARIVLGYRLDLENAVKFARRRFRL
jgi:hypothetical protein